MILLVNPPYYRFQKLDQDYVPLSLLAVGSKISSTGEEVYLKNMEVMKDGKYQGYTSRRDHFDDYQTALNDDNHPAWLELNSLIDEYTPDTIGISVLNVKYQSALKIIDIAKRRKIKVVVGGTHPTIEPDKYSSDVAVWPGEYESANGRINNLDTLPFPDFDILLDTYSKNGYGHLMSSRGCPWKCKFCASKTIWKNKVTFKSPLRMIEEMKRVNDKFGTDIFTFWDETFTCSRARLIEFCYRFKSSGIKAQWRCDTRADKINDDMIKMMKASGCASVSMGVEVGDDATLREIGKDETCETIQRAADILNANGMQWKAYSIIGFPTDTEEVIFKSMTFIKGLKPSRITLNFFTPYRGTPLYDTCHAMGLINADYDKSLFSHQSPHNHFCPKIEKKRFNEIKEIMSDDIDNYNRETLRTWI
jgi:uncharacterized radical SAM superfamily protein